MKTCGNCNEIKIVYRLFWHKAWLSRWRYCKLKSIWLNRHITAICEKNHNKPNISIKRLDEATEDIKYMIDCVTDKEYPNNN